MILSWSYLSEKQEELLQALARWIAIPSVASLSVTTKSEPFGHELSLMLDEALSTAEAWGFQTFRDPHGYYGYADLGQGSLELGVLVHLDVVPAVQNLWRHDPFSLFHDEEGRLIGRGVLDNKGPALSVLYALKLLWDQSWRPKGRVRIVFGLDEEIEWKSLPAYLASEEIPPQSFTPDAQFPLVVAERPLLQCCFQTTIPGPFEWKNLGVLNTVPEQARYEGTLTENLCLYFDSHSYTYRREGTTFIALGKAAHASKASEGINALERILEAFEALDYRCASLDFIRHELWGKNSLLFQELGFQAGDFLSWNLASLAWGAKGQSLWIDWRLPLGVSLEKVQKALEKAAWRHHLAYQLIDSLPSVEFSSDHPFVKTLLEAYRSITGDLSSAVVSGGATYARALPNCIAFGPLLRAREDSSHQINEYLLYEDLQMLVQIYAKAFVQLC